MDAPYYSLSMILLYLWLTILSQRSFKFLTAMLGLISGVDLVAFYFQQ